MMRERERGNIIIHREIWMGGQRTRDKDRKIKTIKIAKPEWHRE